MTKIAVYLSYSMSDKRKEVISMVDTDVLRGLLAQNGFSQAKMAESLGITPKTFYTKMKKKVFDSDEMEIMIKKLNINDPIPVFFADFVTHQVTK